MSKYSSDSESDDYKSKKSKRRKYRSSSSSSSDDSYRLRRHSRRSRKSRSRSREISSRNASKSYRSSRGTTKSKNQSRRSKSPYKSRRYRSVSRSRSASRSPRNKYSKPKRKNRSRSSSRSRSRRSTSRSRRRSKSRECYHRSRSRSCSGSSKKSRRISNDHKDNCESSKHPTKKILEGSRLAEITGDSIALLSDDPILKQEQLDDINELSFVPKSFTSNRSQKHEIASSGRLNASEVRNTEGNGMTSSGANSPNTVTEKRKNETVFHDNIVFEDAEEKIQKWVRKVYNVRQKFLFDNS